MKNILITGGPTNEAIDKVMTITNMSTGSLSCAFAKTALEAGDKVTLIFHHSVLRSAKFAAYGLADNPNVKLVSIDSCQEMLDAIKAEAECGEKYDVIIHAAAVGDYRPEFSFRMEDMAAEIAEKIMATDCMDREALEEFILNILVKPDCVVRDDSKISSYEPHLTTKLTLTTKIISNLRGWFPDALLIGCKLLENVEKDHLYEVAQKLAAKNNMDYIMANDLAELNQGYSYRYLCTKDGFTGTVLDADGGITIMDYAKENWF
ncbi:MAG: hypothetical protein MJ186_07840 [Clostridia bacterium]|nr:hypothetical protein [Clostridia bacterium]